MFFQCWIKHMSLLLPMANTPLNNIKHAKYIATSARENAEWGSSWRITKNRLINRQDFINHHTFRHTQTYTHSSCSNLLFCHPSLLLAAHPYCGCQQKACRCHPSVCRQIRSADWPLTEESPEGGAPAAEHRSGPPSSSAVPCKGRGWRTRRWRRWIRSRHRFIKRTRHRLQKWHLFNPTRTAHLAHMAKHFSSFRLYFLGMRPIEYVQ